MRVGLSLLATLPGIFLPLPVPPLYLHPSGLLSLGAKVQMACAQQVARLWQPDHARAPCGRWKERPVTPAGIPDLALSHFALILHPKYLSNQTLFSILLPLPPLSPQWASWPASPAWPVLLQEPQRLWCRQLSSLRSLNSFQGSHSPPQGLPTLSTVGSV